MLLDPRNAAAWDQPAPSGPPRVYLVASLPRTGSTLLCNALWDTGRAGAPKEYLNPMQRRDWARRRGGLRWELVRGPLLGALGRWPWSDEALGAYLEQLLRLRSGGGCFGLKLHAHHHAALGARAPVRALLAGAAVVRVSRQDRLAQAVSWARAQQTGRWAHWQRGWGPPVYRRAAVDAALARIAAGEAHWDHALAGQRTLHLYYEELAADLQGALARVFQHLGLEGAPPPVRPSLERQADATSLRWAERYRAGG